MPRMRACVRLAWYFVIRVNVIAEVVSALLTGIRVHLVAECTAQWHSGSSRTALLSG